MDGATAAHSLRQKPGVMTLNVCAGRCSSYNPYHSGARSWM
jgi:hypothetical protein